LKIAGIAVIALLLYLIFLLQLAGFTIRPWDESNYAVNAYEMLQRHEYFVRYFNGGIDYNCKPLLTEWVQMLFVKILGFNELAIRLPSALAGMLTACFVFLFVKKMSSTLWAWCSFFVLVTSLGFVHFHTSRTGDTDAMLTLFLFLSNIYLFYYLYSDNNKNRNIFLYFVFLALAFGTKSIAALLFIPAHIFMVLYKKQAGTALKQKGFYPGLLLFIISGALFLLSWQVRDPNYFRNLLDSDVLRIVSVNDGHKEHFDFYLTNFYNYRFASWAALFILGIVILWQQRKRPKMNLIMVWCITLILSHFMLISFSVTKLEWYDMPLYPYLAIAAGYAIYYLLKRLNYFKTSSIWLPFTMALLFSIPICYAVKQSYENTRPEEDRKKERIADYIFMKRREGFNFNNYCICDNAYIGPYLFYKYKLKEVNQNISIVDTSQIKAPMIVMASNDTIQNYVLKKFDCVVMDSYGNLLILDIKKLK